MSRHAHGRTKVVLLVLLVAPFWISYLMRMFGWTNLLDSGGYAARVLNALSIDSLFGAVGLIEGSDWLGGQPITVIMGLVYGYVPYLILPLYASLDRIDQRLIEAARDLGASPASAFRRVVLPLSKAGTLGGIVLIALPMFGDYYTPDLMSGSPKTALLGNTINNYVQGGPDKALGAALTMLLSAFLLVFMLYYLRDAAPGGAGVRRPERPARVITWIYVVWSLLPVLLAIRFAFNEGRSRTSAQGFSLRWFWTDPTLSVRNDPTLRGGAGALAGAGRAGDADRDAARASRWRSACSAGAAAARASSNVLMLLPLVTPELVFAVGLFLLFTSRVRVHRARHDGAGDRAGDVLALVGGADRARAAGDDRQRRRGGGGRPRRAAVGPACGACCCRCWRRRSPRAC